jgi:hypothetical protein
MVVFQVMDKLQSDETVESWIVVAGQPDAETAVFTRTAVDIDISEGLMPPDDELRVKRFSTSLARDGFEASSERIELIRDLCRLYGQGVQDRPIESHRRFVGPIIVGVKKILLRLVVALLGPSFAYQREFNARVIRLLADLSNDSHSSNTARTDYQ